MSRDRAARTVLLVGLVLAALLLGVRLVEPSRESAEDLVPLGLFREEPRVRVRLEQAGDPPWPVACAGGLRLDTGDRRETVGGRALSVGVAGGRVLVDGKPCGERLVLRPRRGEPLTIGGVPFPGSMIVTPRPESPRPVLAVPLETYVACVLPREMPLSYPDAALRAQAIVARTYAVATLLRRKALEWDVVDGASSQAFGGYTGSVARARAQVDGTTGIVVVWEYRPFPTYYAANCGGRTRSNTAAFGEEELPPLAGRRCDFCAWAPDYSWTTRFRQGEVVRKLGLKASIESAAVQGRGRDSEILLRAGGGIVRASGRRLQRKLGSYRIKSSWLTGVSLRADRIAISGRGFGHGVGLCQNGARGMAESGKGTADILAYYYPGSQRARLAW